jgi:hypothetical protein
MSIQPETLAWLRQTAKFEGAVTAQVLLHLLERVDALEQQPTCADSAQVPPTPEAAPVVTDEELPTDGDSSQRQWYSYDPEEGIEIYSSREQAQSAAKSIMGSYQVAAHSDGWHEDMESVSWGMLIPVEHAQIVARGFNEPAEEIEEWVRYELKTAQPPAAEAAWPLALSHALCQAECALSDIAEGEPECDDGDPAQWAEQRCAETLAIIRPVMQQHGVRTSEWPPVSYPTTPVEPAADRVLVNCPETCWIEIRRIADGRVIYNNHQKGTLTIPVGEPHAAPAAPAGGLVERVCRQLPLRPAEARAVILVVAEWLDRYGCHGCSLWLREEVDR